MPMLEPPRSAEPPQSSGMTAAMAFRVEPEAYICCTIFNICRNIRCLSQEKLYGRAKERKSIDFIGKKAVFTALYDRIKAGELPEGFDKAIDDLEATFEVGKNRPQNKCW